MKRGNFAQFGLFWSLLACFLLILPGCGAKKLPFGSKTNLKMVTLVAVSKSLDGRPQRAERVVDITYAALMFVESDETVTLGQLETFLNQKIDEVVNKPDERDWMDAVMVAVAQALIEHVESQGVSNPKERIVLASEVLNWINTAAQYYVEST